VHSTPCGLLLAFQALYLVGVCTLTSALLLVCTLGNATHTGSTAEVQVRARTFQALCCDVICSCSISLTAENSKGFGFAVVANTGLPNLAPEVFIAGYFRDAAVP